MYCMPMRMDYHLMVVKADPPLFPVTGAKDGTISTPVGCTIPELMN